MGQTEGDIGSGTARESTEEIASYGVGEIIGGHFPVADVRDPDPAGVLQVQIDKLCQQIGALEHNHREGMSHLYDQLRNLARAMEAIRRVQ
jgi:hypothetical protein